MVFDEIKALLADKLNIAQEKITMESNIISDLGADSLDIVEMLMTLDQEYGIEIPDEAAAEFKTVGDIVKFVQTKKA
ncbi:MAG: acyl carrier protein [Clostridiales bacterium]|nr:acyl carrier protein [Clostridiales bacterium]MDD6054469.1 acyl carrier protein [Clostridiales bacterium]MDD7506831.1 acyl carrier protein [Clostridiales bacterium]MDY5678252.1 acyl carrier protein [Eubacteriales bacterium]MDY5726963.1 acyl carrier protein [Eubacteriales bacterium]